jgi:hypothetical protein
MPMVKAGNARIRIRGSLKLLPFPEAGVMMLSENLPTMRRIVLSREPAAG